MQIATFGQHATHHVHDTVIGILLGIQCSMNEMPVRTWRWILIFTGAIEIRTLLRDVASFALGFQQP